MFEIARQYVYLITKCQKINVYFEVEVEGGCALVEAIQRADGLNKHGHGMVRVHPKQLAWIARHGTCTSKTVSLDCDLDYPCRHLDPHAHLHKHRRSRVSKRGDCCCFPVLSEGLEARPLRRIPGASSET